MPNSEGQEMPSGQITFGDFAVERAAAAWKAEAERLRASLRFAKGELECLRNWLDRAVASDYRYRDDPALPGHREAADKVSKAIGRDLASVEQAADRKP